MLCTISLESLAVKYTHQSAKQETKTQKQKQNKDKGKYALNFFGEPISLFRELTRKFPDRLVSWAGAESCYDDT